MAPLPPRPVSLSLNDVDPCTLLTDAQQNELGVSFSSKADDGDQFGSRDCIWNNFGGKPANSWLARAVIKQGAEHFLSSTTSTQVVQVGGFAAVQSSSPNVNPDIHCILVIDVAQGQNLWVDYTNRRGDYPGINHDVACKQAAKAAELMINNLRDRS